MALHRIFTGDHKECLKWYPYAHRMLQKMKQKMRVEGNAWAGWDDETPTPEILIQVETAGTEDYIRIMHSSLGLYMESGVIDMRNIAPLNQAASLPGVLRYPDDIQTYWRNDLNAALGRLKINEVTPGKLDGERMRGTYGNSPNQESRAVGCSEDDKRRQFHAENPTTGAVYHFESSEPKWCSGLLGVKRAQVFSPASLYTGAMQQHVQAVYGSKRRDYFVNESIFMTGLEWATPTGAAPYSFNFRAGTGIFKAKNYKYFLIATDVTGVWAKELHPHGAGFVLRSWLIKNEAQVSSDDLHRYETYLMSTLVQRKGDGLVLIKNKKDTHHVYTFGFPWFYGWKFTTKGDKADIVLIRHKPGASFGQSDHFWQATHYRMTINEHSDTSLPLSQDRLRVKFIKLEGPTDFTMRNNQDLIWWPVVGDGMEGFVPKPLNTGSEPNIDSDTPQYCYYDANDNLIVVRYQRDTIGKPWSDVKDLSPASIGTFSTCGTAEHEYDHSADAAITYGFYTETTSSVDFDARTIDYDDFSGAAADIQVLGLESREATPPGGTTYDPSCSGSPWSPASRDFSSVNFYYATGGLLSVTGKVDIPVESLLAIPHMNASAVYMGRFREFNGGLSNQFCKPTTRIVKEFNVTDTNGEYWPDMTVFTGYEAGFTGGDDAFAVKEQANNQGKLLSDGGTLNIGFIQVKHLNRFEASDAHDSTGVINDTSPEWLYFPRGSVLMPWTGLGPDLNVEDGFSKGIDETFSWGGWSNWFDPPNLLIDPFLVDENIYSWDSYKGLVSTFQNGPNGVGGRTFEGFDHDDLISNLEFSYVGHT